MLGLDDGVKISDLTLKPPSRFLFPFFKKIIMMGVLTHGLCRGEGQLMTGLLRNILTKLRRWTLDIYGYAMPRYLGT
jgi:hypothetical protein